ncbi:MAG: hypothetical protein IT186_19500, partial [Acidobacteria bacterium]|nr:hypothetical protein [Acidobacteriota bacterium]
MRLLLSKTRLREKRLLASLKEQLRGLPRFSWQGWNQAAGWCLKNDTALDQGLEWADRSLEMNKNFTNQM